MARHRIVIKDTGSTRIRKIAGLSALGLGVLLLGKNSLSNLIDSIRLKREENQYYDPNNQSSNAQKEALASQLATKFNAGFNPSGVSWLRNTDQTNEKAIFQCARDVAKNKIPWSMMTKAYKGIIDRDLTYDLQSELDSDELDLFNSILAASDPELAFQNVMLKRFGTLTGININRLR